MRQLSLFKGKKQRGVRPPSPLEYASHCFIADLLRRWCSPVWIYTHVPLGEKRDIITASRLKRMGVMPGWPDFQFAAPGAVPGDPPRMFFLELKRKGWGRLSDEQRSVMSHLAASGFQILITDDVNDAVATLKQLGILPSTIGVQ
jgi:hypothetical protein